MKSKSLNKKNIITFREILLPDTETFIESQTSSLSKHENHFVGLRLARKGLKIVSSPTFTVNNVVIGGHIKEYIFKRTGIILNSFIKNLKSINPLLCHAHFGPDAIYAMRISKHLNIPLVVTFHGYDATTLSQPTSTNNFKQKQYFKQRHALIEHTKIFIAVSAFIKSKLLEQGFPEDKIIVHHIGINTNYYKPDLNIQRQNTVLFVGRLVEKKGCQYLIKALSLISKNIPDLKLIVIGEGPLRPELEKQASESSISYEFMGYQSSDVVKQWMCKSRVLCVPSITADNGDSEGFGMVFAEAQAVGTPVVSFQSGGIVEAVLHKKTGLLAKEKDVTKLSQYINTLLTNSELWLEYSNAGRKRVLEEFDLKKQTAKLEEIYQSITKQS